MSTLNNLRFVSSCAIFLAVLAVFGCAGTTVQPEKPLQVPITVAIAEDSVSLGGTESHQFFANVTGTSNTDVTWSIFDCTVTICGTLSSTGLYTAPAVIPSEATLKITATLKADPTKFDSVEVHHMPIMVSIAPVGAWVMPGKSVNFAGKVRYDVSNAGVAWSLVPACSSCGVLTSASNTSVTYAAPVAIPNPSTIKLTATSLADTSKTADVLIAISGSNALNEGDYAFSFDGWEIHYTQNQQYYTTSSVVAAGHFHADSKGNITDGVEDINLESGVSSSVPFTGTYAMGSDGRGSFAITTAQGTSTYHMTVDSSNSRGRFIRFDGLPEDAPIFGSGYFELQDHNAFSVSSLAGPYAFGMSGTVNGPNRTAAVGRFDAGASGAFSGGSMDMTVQMLVGVVPQNNFTNLTLTGSFGAPSASTGRGAATVTLSSGQMLNFAYYITSDEKVAIVETDQRSSTVPALSGELRRQSGPYSATSFNAATIFSMTGANRKEYAPPLVDVLVGRIVPDGINLLTGVLDDNNGALNKGFDGSYTVAPNGRTTMTLNLDPSSPRNDIAYLYGPNRGFLIDVSGTDVWFGRFEPQLDGPFSAASVSGSFVTATIRPPSESTEGDIGLATFDAVGGIASTLDVGRWTDLSHVDLKGTYSIASNGRGMLSFSSPSLIDPITFWVISPTHLVAIGPPHPHSALSDARIFRANVLEYEK